MPGSPGGFKDPQKALVDELVMIGVEENYVHASSQIMLLHPINMFVCFLIGGGGVLFFIV